MSKPTFAATRTGSFPIGIRRVGSAWQKDTDGLIEWAIENQFGVIDLQRSAADGDAARIKAAGLEIGSVDLLGGDSFKALISADAGERKKGAAAMAEHIERSAAAGARNFFTVMIPADPTLPRRQNFDYMAESYAALVPVLDRTDSRIVIEGWPGPGVMVCTPETYRALFSAIESKRIGINYDPSHLLRMGIDPLRFLKEFADRVYHVHGKDTAMLSEDLYEFGHELPRTFSAGYAWGGASWRYTIPGHGLTDWSAVFTVLRNTGYQGFVSIELEDANFNGTEAGEQLGFIKSRQFLEGC